MSCYELCKWPLYHISKRYHKIAHLRKLHPRGFDEYRYPHFQKSQGLKLCGGLAWTKIANFHAGRVFILAYKC